MKSTKEIETAFMPNQAVVERWLNEAGYESSQERVIGRHTIDIFLDRKNIGIEVDGPWHYHKRDAKRDKELLDKFGVRIFRIKDEDVFESNKEQIMKEFEDWLNSEIKSNSR